MFHFFGWGVCEFENDVLRRFGPTCVAARARDFVSQLTHVASVAARVIGIGGVGIQDSMIDFLSYSTSNALKSSSYRGGMKLKGDKTREMKGKKSGGWSWREVQLQAGGKPLLQLQLYRYSVCMQQGIF
jgi:hypothetical protein